MEYLIYFYVYSFLGWVLETAYASIRLRRYCSKQTLLKSPLCPIYGIGAVLMLLLLSPDAALLVFSGGFFLASSVEYLVSVYYLHAFGIRRWNYTGSPGNVGGHVCAGYSILWGIFALWLLYWLHPAVQSFVSRLDARLLSITSLLLCVWVIQDFRDTKKELKRYAAGEENCIETKFSYVTKP